MKEEQTINITGFLRIPIRETLWKSAAVCFVRRYEGSAYHQYLDAYQCMD